MDKTTFQQTLPMSLNALNFDSNLLAASRTLKDFIHHNHHKMEILDLQKKGIPLQTQNCLIKILF